MSRNNSLAAMRARYERLLRPGLSEGAHALACASSASDVGVLLKRLGADEEPDPELGLTPPLVITVGDMEFFATCGDCGAPLGSIRPDGQTSTFFLNWERHARSEHADV